MQSARGIIAILLFLLAVMAGQAIAADNVVFVFDASNSMNKPFEGSSSRFDAAISAMAELLVQLPQDINAGLLLYGWRIGWKNEVESCKDIELVYPIQPLTSGLRLQMSETLGAIVAQGKTPLADSLVRAAMAFNGLQGENAVVLISDGEGNCGGNHSAAAHYLATFTPPIRLHVIGLDLDPEATETLQMMVEVTGGTYRSVREAANLAEALYAAVVGETPEGSAPVTPLQPTPGVPAEFAGFGITNIIWGTEGDDILFGTEQNDLIYGLGGNDFIVGYAGDDIIFGGPGNDIIQGLEGNDLLFGEEGDDILLGGAGDDILCGGPGRDSLEGEAGNDYLDGGPGDDRLLGGPGNNQLVQDGGNDVLLEGWITQTRCPQCVRGSICGPVAPVTSPSSCPMPPVSQPAAPAQCPTPVPASSGGCTSPKLLKTVDEGTNLQLHGFVTDEDCDVTSIEWTVARGHLSDPHSLDPIFYAPMTDKCEGEDVLVRLIARDSCGATGEDCFLIHVNNVNRPPYADAGPDICIDEGTTVQLTCSGSDPDGDPVTYAWRVKSGRGTFSNPSALHPMFTAPMTTNCEGEDLVLTLTVTDSCGLSTTDSMVVHVNNVNKPPTVVADP